MPYNTRLKSLEFQSLKGLLSSVVVELTNGYKSPMLGLSQKNQRNRQKVQFDSDLPKEVKEV